MDFETFVVDHARKSGRPHSGVKFDDTMSFFHHLATLVTAGTPLMQALRICAEQCQSLKLRRTLEEIAFRVSSGSTLNAAAAAHPEVFQHHWIEVIRTGEITGKMGIVLLELNKQIQESRETRRKVSGSLTYPIILIIVAAISVTVMLWLVVPTFANMFRDMGSELPAMTQYVVDASAFVSAYGAYLAAGVVLFALLFRKFARTETGRRALVGCGLVTPLVGEMMVSSAMYRFASTIALLLKSGVPMLDTMGTLVGVYQNNPLYRKALQHAQALVASGRSLASALEDTGLFTSMMISMVKIGEESGELSEVMNQVAPYYKEKLEATILRITKMLEPIIIMGMGTGIAGIMLAIYMPMFEMAGKIH